MPKYKVGDVLKSQQNNQADLEVMAIVGKLIGFKNLFHGDVFWQQEPWLEIKGYTLAQPARWVPKEGGKYQFLDDAGGTNGISIWQNDRFDHFRLSIGNVFQVGDHAGIEALKRKWQEGNNTFNS